MKYIFENGGFIMYLLLFASIVSLGVILEKAYYYFKYEKLKKNFDYLIIADKNNNIIPKNSLESLIRILIEETKKNTKVNYFHLEEKAREYTLNKMLKFEDKLWLLALISNISPLLGLFGTVTGMIGAFNVIAVAGTGDPKLLADGISKALITTAAGLIVAVPSVFSYNYLNKKIDMVLNSIEKSSVEIINVLRKR